jgi:nucleoside-diphosphate-sugar epimerase
VATKKVLVTGATGFIGTRLVQQLVRRGDHVTCLVRRTSNASRLKKLHCQLVYGDTVESPESIVKAVANVETVYHLAASTHVVHSHDLVRINATGTRNVLSACESRTSPPEIVIVSSLAAVGPSFGSQLHSEVDERNPVSFYGRSKAACELDAIHRAERLPISIVRPPIVLGGGDRNGLQLFRVIDQWGWHVIPGFLDRLYSVIHVDDLGHALMAVADQGKRLSNRSLSDAQGIYFASHHETFTYAGLGKLVGKALGRNRTRILRIAKPCMWVFAAINEVRGRINGSPEYVNLDKFHEAYAGSWACSSKKLHHETSFELPTTMFIRLQETADWYRNQGWLRDDRHHAARPVRLPPRESIGHAPKAH